MYIRCPTPYRMLWEFSQTFTRFIKDLVIFCDLPRSHSISCVILNKVRLQDFIQDFSGSPNLPELSHTSPQCSVVSFVWHIYTGTHCNWRWTQETNRERKKWNWTTHCKYSTASVNGNCSGLLIILQLYNSVSCSSRLAHEISPPELFSEKLVRRSQMLFLLLNITDSRHKWHTCGRLSWQIPHTQFIVLIILYFNLHTICNMRCNLTHCANVLCQIRKTKKKIHSACGKKWKHIPQPNAGVLTSEG